MGVHGKYNGKAHQHSKSKPSPKLIVDKKWITLETDMAEKLNDYFHKSWSKLIPIPSKSFASFL